MSTPSLPRRLTSTDAAFLYAEREDAPMHIGAVAIVDGDLDSAAYGRVDRRQARAPAAFPARRWCRRRSTSVTRPGSTTRGSISRKHVFAREVAAPGGRAELFAAAAEVFTGMLDRSQAAVGAPRPARPRGRAQRAGVEGPPCHGRRRRRQRAGDHSVRSRPHPGAGRGQRCAGGDQRAPRRCRRSTRCWRPPAPPSTPGRAPRSRCSKPAAPSPPSRRR